ncbi:ROK family transcriptional regulator [Marinomonas foliarum]|uniref:MarR family transcriptional regulator n=1 Tax=Marinomonas foliarum TaxID=491950 RepID=A0A369AMT0_9GAMM|nr:ROK family transcriptional regulator [Marinomonas foliarum]RCX08754.1 MarR family transcriptional regulator [Marinomonas foliarum]
MPDMRFSPPNPLRIADRTSGLNAVRVRSHNERLVLSMLLRNGNISRLKIGESSGLSAQTVSVIVRSLEKEGLIVSGSAQKGRVGPPTIPLSLNAEGAYSIGISIGIRKTHVVLINFLGEITAHSQFSHEFPGNDIVHPDIFVAVEELLSKLSVKKRERVAGIGLALADTFRESEALNVLRELLEKEFSLEVFIQTDITSAASGESMFGKAKNLENYLFFYIGAQIHSRLVLNHQILRSATSATYDGGTLELEKRLGSDNLSINELEQLTEQESQHSKDLQEWTEQCSALIREKLRDASQFVDVEALLLSSYIPNTMLQNISTALVLPETGPEVVVSELTKAPKAVGAASLPFAGRFML